MLGEARKRLSSEDLAGVELRLGEMAHLPLSDGEAQVALLNMVLHHAPQPSAVLAELARVLAPGGTLLIADLARHEKEWLREQMADQWLGFGEDELQGWLVSAGFDGADCRLVSGQRDEQGVLICRAGKR
jgi:ArsR family transcriptional regulator